MYAYTPAHADSAYHRPLLTHPLFFLSIPPSGCVDSGRIRPSHPIPRLQQLRILSSRVCAHIGGQQGPRLLFSLRSFIRIGIGNGGGWEWGKEINVGHSGFEGLVFPMSAYRKCHASNMGTWELGLELRWWVIYVFSRSKICAAEFFQTVCLKKKSWPFYYFFFSFFLYRYHFLVSFPCHFFLVTCRIYFAWSVFSQRPKQICVFSLISFSPPVVCVCTESPQAVAKDRLHFLLVCISACAIEALSNPSWDVLCLLPRFALILATE